MKSSLKNDTREELNQTPLTRPLKTPLLHRFGDVIHTQFYKLNYLIVKKK